MATVFKVRSGSAFKTTVEYRQPDGELVDTSGHTATLQIRATNPPTRVLMSVSEYSGEDPAPAGTVLALVEPGKWRIFLGKTFTKSLPPSSQWELELINDDNDEDTITLATGMIKAEPEGVTGVE